MPRGVYKRKKAKKAMPSVNATAKPKAIQGGHDPYLELRNAVQRTARAARKFREARRAEQLILIRLRKAI